MTDQDFYFYIFSVIICFVVGIIITIVAVTEKRKETFQLGVAMIVFSITPISMVITIIGIVLGIVCLIGYLLDKFTNLFIKDE